MEKINENFVDLWKYFESHESQIEESLREHLPVSPPKIEAKFNEAIEFVLFSDDEKRLRPVLTLLGAELFGGKAEEVLPSAVAVEYIGASSRIFSEIYYAGDNENSLSSKFGDGLAILVAVSILNASYPLVFVNHIGMPERAMQTHAEIVECVGASGLISGLTFDLGTANDDLEKSQSVKNLRNSALTRLALRVGAILAGADYLDLANLSRFAELLGNAYQISDSLVDFDKNNELTNVSKQTNENAQLKLNDLTEEAKGILFDGFSSNEARSCLIQLTEYLAERSV